MAHARHKAPTRAARLDPRRTDAAVALTGVAMLALAIAGATESVSEGAPSSVALASSDASSLVLPPTGEIADLRLQRQDALLQASRAADRLATNLVPPREAADTVPELPPTTAAFTTVAANIRAASSDESPILGVLDPGAEIAVTGRTAEGYAEIVHAGQLAWVWAGYLSTTLADVRTTIAGGVSAEPCASGSGVESGLTSNAIAVHRVVCALFPGVSSYGGLRPGDGGEHGSGQALDIMVSTDLGNQIVAYLQPLAAELGIRELIWQQRIWSTDRAGDGWRWMEDRGSATANHYDHVHVTVA